MCYTPGMADDATRIIALERLLERTREKATKDRTRLERELRRVKAQLRDAQEKLERYERKERSAQAVEQSEADNARRFSWSGH